MLGVAAARHGAALQVGDDLVEAVAERVAAGGEEQDQHAEEPEHDEVERAVDRDQAQHDLVAQRASAQRQLDLVAVGQVRDRGRPRARAAAASCRSAGSGASARRRSRARRARPRAAAARASIPISSWPATPADQQLVVEARQHARRALVRTPGMGESTEGRSGTYPAGASATTVTVPGGTSVEPGVLDAGGERRRPPRARRPRGWARARGPGTLPRPSPPAPARRRPSRRRAPPGRSSCPSSWARRGSAGR